MLFLVSTLFFSIFFNKKWLLISLFGILLNTIPVFSFFLPEKSGPIISNKTSLLLTNVFSQNKNHGLLLNEIKNKQPDFIVVLELNTQWAQALTPIKKEYPFEKVIPRRDNFGIALYSKHPLHEVEVHDFAGNNIPSITAKSIVNGKLVNIIATHPFPPINQEAAEQQKLHLINLANFVNDLNQPKEYIILAGDLNNTPWSPRYKIFIQQTELVNTRQGRGVFPSWPTGLKYSVLQIPLDHILVSRNIQTQIIKKLNPIGSDHLPIYVELGLYETGL